MSDRCPCVVPFCRRTTKQRWKNQEWICGQHWRGVPRSMRQRLFRLRRISNRFWRKIGHRSPVSAGMADHQWALCKAAAIEAAVGIA